MNFSTSMFKRFRNPKDKRDFVTAGVSVGVATAFNAPIGGLLFAFEEVASFWQQSLGWQVRRDQSGPMLRYLLHTSATCTTIDSCPGFLRLHVCDSDAQHKQVGPQGDD